MGSVVGLKIEVLHLSGVYDMLREYDSDIQNKLSKQEMLYWLNEDFSISAKIGTQIKNADSPESASLQRIEEIWFSRSGVGDIIKTRNLIGSGIGREDGNTQTQEILLQCGEWGYVYRGDTRDTKENIRRVDGQETKTRKYRKNTTISNQTIQQSEISSDTFGDNKESNRETKESQEISNGIKEPKEWSTSTASNRKEYARSKVQGISFPLQTKNDNEAITKREWIQLSVHKEMETTLVKTNFSIDIFLGKFELMCGGSPCQDLSIAKKDRKGLSGERSGLFWEYVRILKEVKPKYFILENVNSMPKEAKQLITETLGVEPIMINAALVSAQNRKRLFWTNIPNVVLPEDRGTLLKDILEENVDEKYHTKNVTLIKGGTDKKTDLDFIGGIRNKDWAKDGKNYSRNFGQGDRVYSPNGKATTLSALGGGRGAKTGLYAVPVALRNRGEGKKPEYNGTGKANSMTTVQTDSMVQENSIIRKLTPMECERLQGLKDGYTEGVSNSQRYKCLGNAFNVDVVAHILKHL